MFTTICALVLATALGAAGKSPYEVGRFDKHQGEVTDVVIAPDGEVVTAGSDKTIRRWDMQTLAERGDEPVPSYNRRTRLAISPKGDLLASVWFDSSFYLWVRKSPKAGVINAEVGEALSSAAFSPDGKWLAIGDDEGAVSLWDTSGTYDGKTFSTSRGDLKKEMTVIGGAKAIVFAPDSTTLLTLGAAEKGYKLEAWNAPAGQSGGGLTTDGPALAVDPRGKSFVTGRNVWAPPKRDPQATLSSVHPLECAIYAPDGKWIATGGLDNRLAFWDPSTGKRLAIVRAHDDQITGVAVTKDGQRIVTASKDRTARVWDVAKILTEKPQEEPYAKLAKLPRAYAAWRLGACWSRGIMNYQPGQPKLATIDEAERRALALGVTWPGLPKSGDGGEKIDFLRGNQEAMEAEVKKRLGDTESKLFSAGALLPLLQVQLDPQDEAAQDMIKGILASFTPEFVSNFGALPTMFERFESNLRNRASFETTEKTFSMIIRELDITLEGQARQREAEARKE